MENPQKRIDKLLNSIRAQESILEDAKKRNKMVAVMKAEGKIRDYKAEIKKIQDKWM